MLNTLNDDVLSRIEAMDRGVSSEMALAAGWHLVNDVRTAVDTASAEIRRATYVTRGLLVAGVLLPFVAVGSVFNSKVVAVMIVLPVVALLVPFLLLYLSRGIPLLCDRRVHARLRRSSLRAYLEGGSPLTGRRFVLGQNYLFLIAKDRAIASIPLADVSTIGVDVRTSGALMVAALGSGFIGLSTVGRVAGPYSLRWSYDGFLGIGKLRKVLIADLETREIPSALTDWSAPHL